MRFRNTQNHPLAIRDLGLEVGPGGEFEYPGWDLGTHGVITGCEPIGKTRSRKASGDSGQDDAADNSAGATATSDTPTGGDAASKETTQP